MKLKRKRPQTTISKGISLLTNFANASMETTHPVIRIIYKMPCFGLLSGCQTPLRLLIKLYFRFSSINDDYTKNRLGITGYLVNATAESLP